MDPTALMLAFQTLQRSWRDLLPKDVDSDDANRILDLALDAFLFARSEGADRGVAERTGRLVVEMLAKELDL